MSLYTGIWIPLVTPFRDGAVDLDALSRLTDIAARAGCRGVVVCGTTGEPATLSEAEKRAVLAAVVEAAAGRLGLMFGLSGAGTDEAAEAARAWSVEGVDALLVTAPYYVRPSQEGIRRHFEVVAAASARPLVLYNIPYRTGVNIALDTVRRLAENPRVVAIKECGSGDVDMLHDLIHQTPLKVLAGEDHMFFLNACMGGHGAIAAAAHVRPDLYVRVLDDVRAGRLAEARATVAALVPLIRALFAEPNPAPVKAALALRGRIRDELRLPMTPMSEAGRARLARVMEAVEALP